MFLVFAGGRRSFREMGWMLVCSQLECVVEHLAYSDGNLLL